MMILGCLFVLLVLWILKGGCDEAVADWRNGRVDDAREYERLAVGVNAVLLIANGIVGIWNHRTPWIVVAASCIELIVLYFLISSLRVFQTPKPARSDEINTLV